MPNSIIILIGLLALIPVLVFLIGVLGKNENKHQHERTISYLQKMIESEQETLSNIQHQISNTTLDRTSSLTKVETSVLDIYEESNIKIPVDIIEECSRMNLHTEKEVFAYIENQRLFWKLENTKKPYRKP